MRAGDLHQWQAEDALRAEARLLDRVASGLRPYGCKIWTTEPCLVAPRRWSGNPNFAAAAEDLSSKGWPVFLRNTGGDVTPQGPGILNVSIAFAQRKGATRPIENGFEVLCAPIFEELAALGLQGRFGSVPGAFCDGDYNVVVGNRKVAGTAQRMRRLTSDPGRRAVFAHALILFDANLPAGIEAVKRLRRACGLPGAIDVEAHRNLAALLSESAATLSAEALARRLYERFERDLRQLTSATPVSRPEHAPSRERFEEDCPA